MVPSRVVVVWCPDWPVVAGMVAEGLAAQNPVAVVAANRVVACTAAARAQGVRRGQRRREAQGRCPELVVLADDPDRDARAFEPVIAAVEALAPGVEVVRSGLVAVPARGPTRYFGSEPAVAERIVDVVAARAGVECQIGIADGLFAATLAAHRGLLVPPEGSAGFLAALGIAELDQPATGPDRAALVDLLHRLGLRTLGAFAALAVDDVASRFGVAGVRAHRLAQGLDERSLARRDPPVDFTITRRLDPPVGRVDAAAFASREPAEQLHAALASRGLACVRLGVSACTETGEELHRVWRCAEPLTASGIADRVRWQLDGWLTSRGPRPSSADASTLQAGLGGITLLQLTPEEVIGGQALQRGLWGESGEDDERAGRALVRVQGMLGPEAVLTGVLGGGRSPVDRVRLVPWGDDPTPARDPDPPWPGRLPAPSPSRVPTRPLAAEVLDDAGRVVGVSGRGRLTGVPYRIAMDGNPPRRVLTWAGPWLVEERWWEPGGGRRCARLQAVLETQSDDGRTAQPLAVLLACETGRWRVEGIYE
jgi:protein ImuB